MTHRLTQKQAAVAHALAKLNGHTWAMCLSVDEVVGKTRDEIAELTASKQAEGTAWTFPAPRIGGDGAVIYLARINGVSWDVDEDGGVGLEVDREDGRAISLCISGTDKDFPLGYSFITPFDSTRKSAALPLHIHEALAHLRVLRGILPNIQVFEGWLISRLLDAEQAENFELIQAVDGVLTRSNNQVLNAITILALRLKAQEGDKTLDLEPFLSALQDLKGQA